MPDRLGDELLSYTQMEIGPSEVRVGDKVFDGERWQLVQRTPYQAAELYVIPVTPRHVGVGTVGLLCEPGDTVEVRRGS